MSTDTSLDQEKKSTDTAKKKVVQTKKAPKKQKPNNKNILKYAVIFIILVILGVSGFLWYVFYGPRWGTMHYGVCKIFAERWIDFPSTMKIREVEYFGYNARLFISHIDAAGQWRYNVIECEYGQATLQITRIRIDRKVLSDLDTEDPINPQILDNFNMGLDAILLNPPSLLQPRSKKGVPLADLWQGDL